VDKLDGLLAVAVVVLIATTLLRLADMVEAEEEELLNLRKYQDMMAQEYQEQQALVAVAEAVHSLHHFLVEMVDRDLF
jgi:hypothetical protein